MAHFSSWRTEHAGGCVCFAEKIAQGAGAAGHLGEPSRFRETRRSFLKKGTACVCEAQRAALQPLRRAFLTCA